MARFVSGPPSHPRVLLVADPERIAELAAALAEPFSPPIEVLHSTGGDDTIELFEQQGPSVVVLTAALEAGDAKALIDALRGMAARAHVAFVLVGDDTGPIRTALDAMELGPERFITRPLAPKALRYAVGGLLEAVGLVRGNPSDGVPGVADTNDTKAAMRARWEAIADSMVEWNADDSEDVADDDIEELEPEPEPESLPPPIIIKPRRRTEPLDEVGAQMWQPGSTSEIARAPMHDVIAADPVPPQREPTLIIREPAPLAPPPLPPLPPMPRTKTSSRPPLPPPLPITDEDSVVLAQRGENDAWSQPIPLVEYSDRDSKRELTSRTATSDDLADLDDFDDDMVLGNEPATPRTISEGRLEVLGDLQPDTRPTSPLPMRSTPNLGRVPPLLPGGEDAGAVASVVAADGRDFARQLRAKMSMMAQRLFAGGDVPASAPGVDHAHGPRHDHHTEIDLASLGEEQPLGGGVTEIEGRYAPRPIAEVRELQTSPGSWDTQVRERGLPDTGELVRGTSDAPMLLAKTFASQATCHITFRRNLGGDLVEKVVYFDQGRPVFAASNEPLDRMGELLVREGKITAAQYERCQAVVAESGRRMGEILVDFGYLKRRELLPAVRRHVEDILYSLFGWDSGQYQISLDPVPSAERIRLSRHPAALVLEGIRRKLDRSTLERMVGPPSTVIEVPDRERLGGIINLSDLGIEERAALAAIDGQVDLTSVARSAGVDVADLLPLAWGLCVLGLASARRTDTEIPDESTALVGETDLAIDRERVRARWQLVSEADYFALLGVRRDATTFEIRRAYQSARRDFASDCFPNDLRRELARELDDIANVLDEAFRVLRDDRLRVTYLTNLFD